VAAERSDLIVDRNQTSPCDRTATWSFLLLLISWYAWVLLYFRCIIQIGIHIA